MTTNVTGRRVTMMIQYRTSISNSLRFCSGARSKHVSLNTTTCVVASTTKAFFEQNHFSQNIFKTTRQYQQLFSTSSVSIKPKNTKLNVDDDFWSREDIKPTTLDDVKLDVRLKLDAFKAKYPIGTGNEVNAVSEDDKKQPLFPSTRHSSRHFPGPLCRYNELETSTEQFLRREFGSLYQVPSSSFSTIDEEEKHIFQLREQVEYLMQGHSACIKDSYLQRQVKHLLVDMKSDELPLFIKKRIENSRMCYNNQYFNSLQESTEKSAGTDNSIESIQTHIKTMTALLERLEEEADLYWTRKQSQLVLDQKEATYDKRNMEEAEYLSSTNTVGSSDASVTTIKEEGDPTPIKTYDSNEKNAKAALWKECGPPPGPSTKMYDLILDGYASLMNQYEQVDSNVTERDVLTIIQQMKKIQFRAVRRYEYDGEASNTNPYTMTTKMTWNAPLRALSYVPYDFDNGSEKVRDEVLAAAFYIYANTNDRHRIDKSIQKNGASYVYMLRILNKFIPHSRSKGNMARAIFDSCCTDDYCVTQDVLNVMLDEYKPNTAGSDFLEYQLNFQKHDMTKVSQLPKQWLSRNQSSRYQLWDDGSY